MEKFRDDKNLNEAWVSISELARMRGVTKAAISKRVARLGIETRNGPRNIKLVNLATFDYIVGSETDGVRELNGSAALGNVRGKRGESQILTREQARRASYDADLKRLELEERLEKLIPVVDVTHAMSRCAEVMVRTIDQITSRSEEIASAIASDGVAGARKELKAIAREMRETLARELQHLASSKEADKIDDDEWSRKQ